MIEHKQVTILDPNIKREMLRLKKDNPLLKEVWDFVEIKPL
jgi:hypothetical protein